MVDSMQEADRQQEAEIGAVPQASKPGPSQARLRHWAGCTHIDRRRGCVGALRREARQRAGLAGLDNGCGVGPDVDSLQESRMTILVCNLSRDHAKAWNALGTSAASLIKMHWQSSKEGLWPAWRRLGAATELATLRATSNHAGMAAHRELRGSPAVADRFPVQSATCVLQTILMLRPRPTHLDKGVAGAGAAEDGGALQPYPGGVSDATGQRGAHRGRRRRQRGRCGHGERRPAVGHRRVAALDAQAVDVLGGIRGADLRQGAGAERAVLLGASRGRQSRLGRGQAARAAG